MLASATPLRILGIDPGSQRTGVGIIDVAADGKVAFTSTTPARPADVAVVVKTQPRLLTLPSDPACIFQRKFCKSCWCKSFSPRYV